MTKIFVSEDIFLKQPELNEASELFKLVDINREFLREWMGWLDYTKSEIDIKNFIKLKKEEFKKKKGLALGVYFKDELCGVVGFHDLDSESERASMGYWLSQSHNGRGIMTQSVARLIESGFKDWNLNSIHIYASPNNEKSCAIPEQLGFRKIGVIPQREKLYDKFVDHTLYVLLRQDWKDLI